MEENITTVVFRHEDEAQRRALMDFVTPKWDAKDSLRVTALSADHEMTRVRLIEEALERIDDPFDLRDVISEICECPNLSKWEWP